MGVFLARFSLQMDRFSDPVATHPCTNEAEVPPRGQKPLDGVPKDPLA